MAMRFKNQIVLCAFSFSSRLSETRQRFTQREEIRRKDFDSFSSLSFEMISQSLAIGKINYES
jgi:hypothetical protein